MNNTSVVCSDRYVKNFNRMAPMKFDDSIRQQGLEVANKLADWLCQMQHPQIEIYGDAGRLDILVNEDGAVWPGSQWNAAFGIMAWLSAYKVFGNERYLDAAFGAARYLKSLQIFSPFMKKHYGAIREMTPQTTWCYPRDSISAAWGFIELYRYTGDSEWLERAELFADWFLREALDEDGWPYWGIVFEELMEKKNPPQICNDVQGCFHGGGLNFFYQLAKVTGDSKWTGEFYIRMADYFVEHIQQPDGFFRSIVRSTRKPPKGDPQGGLHRANDDLGTLALLGVYKVTGDRKYLHAIEKFLFCVFAKQDDEGMFEESVAGIPVILNTIREGGDKIDVPQITNEACEKALQALYRTQDIRGRHHKMHGGLLELPQTKDYVCVRSGCYSLIYLLKEFAGIKDFLMV